MHPGFHRAWISAQLLCNRYLTEELLSMSFNPACAPSAGKAFDITYVRLKFHTSRPESFAIYKRTREGGPWVPYQYYSGSCEKTYRKAGRGFIRTGEDEQQALCTDDFSDISPLTGGQRGLLHAGGAGPARTTSTTAPCSR
ncbi:hypothetical protein CgunFtcFv8_024032 [Champsocephalus gunnari]|uniref:Laminin N-terminal domain-containing protein n=1 Tax=Champsocephalus gunnari TaxID=52237 RepID=A0AAN8HLF2_CHAGU|nr:hypothetical protein CgunFtcFv8_024032 [Champsocephalus gunnari]